MSVPAHTNNVGYYEQWGSRRRWYKTTYVRGGESTGEGFRDICLGTSAKSRTVQSDHHSPTNYSRSVGRLMRDTPNEHRATVYYDGKIDKYEESNSWYSLAYPLQSMAMPAGFFANFNNAISKSRTEARNALREGTVQNGVDILEARKTVDMIAGDASQLWQSVKAAKQGRWSKIPDILGMSKKDVLSGGSVSNRFLEYQYGWKPVMSSIHDNMALLHRGIRQPDATFRTKATGSTSFKEDLSGGGTRRVWDCKGFSTVTYESRMANSFVSSLDTTGLLNPLSIAWELVPFSFVIDWGIPVGNVLSSLSATLGLDFVAGWESQTTSGTFTVSGDGSDPTISVPGGFEYKQHNFVRNVLSNYSPPELYGKDNPFSTQHVANAIALFRSLF